MAYFSTFIIAFAVRMGKQISILSRTVLFWRDCCVSWLLCIHRKRSILLSHVFVFIGATLSCSCVAANAPEMLMIGRFFLGINSGKLFVLSFIRTLIYPSICIDSFVNSPEMVTIGRLFEFPFRQKNSFIRVAYALLPTFWYFPEFFLIFFCKRFPTIRYMFAMKELV